jgi:transposase
VITDARRVSEVLVGLPDVTVLGLDDRPGQPVVVYVEQAGPRPSCVGCGAVPVVKDREVVELVDLPYGGRPSRLAWRKIRWTCPDQDCAVSSWTWSDPRIGAPRQALTDRAGRWVTLQVGRNGRSVSEVADELGCAWHTVNAAVIAYGEALVDDDADRIGTVVALGLDETLFCRSGPYRTQHWSTSIVDVAGGRLLDVVEGRTSAGPCAWLARRSPVWRANIAWATLDLSGPYRTVFDTMLPDAVQIADPFHLIRLANQRLDECRRRVQNQTLGHRGRKIDPLYRARRLLTRADERLDEKGRTRLLGLLDAGDPDGDVRTTWQAKEVVRSIYDHHDPDVALEFVTRLGHDLQDRSYPAEVNSLGRTLIRWRHQIAAWHQAHHTNAATEAANNLIKRVKRAAFGFTNFRSFRVRVLLYAGRPNWDLLPLLTPR